MKFGIEGNELESSYFQGNQSWKDHRWENVEDISCYVSLRQHLTSILMKNNPFCIALVTNCNHYPGSTNSNFNKF